MNWEAFGSIAEFLGAIAVVASLFYVGAQVRESSRATRGQTLNQLTSDMNANLRETLSNEKLMDIALRAVSSEELEAAEVTLYSGFVQSLVRSMESAHYQYQLGLLDESRFYSLIHSATIHLQNPVGERFWESRSNVLDPEFKKIIESHLETSAIAAKQGHGL